MVLTKLTLQAVRHLPWESMKKGVTKLT